MAANLEYFTVPVKDGSKGKTFYGCERYPDCDFVAWNKPIAEKCPECGGAYLLEKYLKAGAFAQCPNAECKYKRELAPA